MELLGFDVESIQVTMTAEEAAAIAAQLRDAGSSPLAEQAGALLTAACWLPLIFGQLPPAVAMAALHEAKARAWEFRTIAQVGVWLSRAPLPTPR